MKYGISMYRGGEVVSADNGSYNICKDLGIKCPFCHEAVFWRKGVNTPTLSIAPSFCHYKKLGEDCELRAKRPDGIKYVEFLEVEAKNQRLKIYNKKLWDILVAEKPISNKQLKVLLNYDKTKILNIVKSVQKDLKQTYKVKFDIAYQHYLSQFNNLLIDLKFGGIVEKAFSKDEVLKEFHQFSETDKQLQKKISLEVLQFLCTKTGGYAFMNLFLVSLWELCLNTYVIKMQKKATGEAIMFLPLILKLNNFNDIIEEIIILIILNTNWIKYLY